MALETISQILSSTNATYINGVSAERRISPAILKNMYQGLVEKDGRGVNDKFVTEDDATSSAQVFVNRVLPVKMKPREMGANKNGASFSQNQHFVQTETVGIEILQVLDDPIIIPRARQDMIKVDLLAEQTKIYSDRLRTIVNGATFASKVLKTWIEDAAGHEVYTKVLTTAGGANILNQFIEANSLLDEGDSEHGIDLFPEDTRVCVIKPAYRATLKTSGVLVLGGANYAYDIAKGAAISTEAKVSKTEDGYIGEIDGVPCHVISNESLQHASGFLGFGESEIKASPLIGYISSSYANARGVSTSKLTKVVDTRGGQGLELQPYCKFGVASWYAKGNVILASEDGFNPVKELKRIFEDYLGEITFKLKGAGSRLYPTITLGAVGDASTTVEAVALDDWNVGHVVAVAYCVSTTPVSTFNEFVKAFDEDGNADLGTVTDGEFSESVSYAVGAGQYFCVLAISDDGSVSVASKQHA